MLVFRSNASCLRCWRPKLAYRVQGGFGTESPVVSERLTEEPWLRASARTPNPSWHFLGGFSGVRVQERSL